MKAIVASLSVYAVKSLFSVTPNGTGVSYCQYVDLLLILIAAARSGIAARRATSPAHDRDKFFQAFTVARLLA